MRQCINKGTKQNDGCGAGFISSANDLVERWIALFIRQDIGVSGIIKEVKGCPRLTLSDLKASIH